MSDIVNEFFRKHYPEDWNTNWEGDWYRGGVWRRYRGEASTLFPLMVCADGLELSVQGHFGAYSYPCDDFAEDDYQNVEVMTKVPVSELGDLDHKGSDYWLYADVPVKKVIDVINAHGGLA